MALPVLVKDRPVLSVALAGVSALAVLRLVRRLRKCFQPGEDVPWMDGWRPFVGHMPILLKYMNDNNKLASGRMTVEVKTKEGKDIFKADMMGKNMVVVTDLHAVEEIVTNDPARFAKTFGNVPSTKFYRQLFGNGLFFSDSDSDDWKVAHGILKAPFSVKGVKTVFPTMCEQADHLVSCLKREVGYGGICHIDHWVTKMAFETIAVCTTGTSFGSFDSDQDAGFIQALNHLLEGFGPMLAYPPSLWEILFRKRLADMRASSKVMRDQCVEAVRKRRNKESQTVTAKKDIMDMMLEDTDPKTGKKLTEVQIVDNVFTFLLAGQDSTAASMASLMCFLHANPRCKEKLMKEIDDTVGQGPLEYDQLSQLHYLDWCIKETLRLVPPVTAIARTAQDNQLLLNRWRVPAGTMVLVGVMALHYDKKVWGEDAHVFRPERWENGPPHKYAFMPFAVGPRACTGREFTVTEQKITFVKLFQHFDYRRPDNVTAEPGYKTKKKEDQTLPPFAGMDVEFKTTAAFVGLFSSFELLERKR